VAARYDLTIVGLGSAGLVAAELASHLGVRVAAVERDRVGGDCLWTGCVPSKALLASAKAAHTMRHADRYGIEAVEPRIDTARVFGRIRAVQRSIQEAEDNADHVRAMGVDVLEGPARVTGAHTLTVGDRQVETKHLLVCTGSRPAIPPIEGLAEAGHLTSETLWDLGRAPRSIAIVGAGPVGVELAQAFARLGVRVTLLERGERALPRDEPALVDTLVRRLREEGVALEPGVDVDRVAREGEARVLHAGERSWRADVIVAATGRRPVIDGLGLEAVGVEVGAQGIVVDDRLRTSVDWIYAAGDVIGRHLFTHSAGFEAARAVRNMLFPGRDTSAYTVPWCTFTDPELAHVGLLPDEARERHGDDAEIVRLELADNDRARTESASEGAIVVVTVKDRIVGAQLLAPSAGEVAPPQPLLDGQRQLVDDLAGVVHVYPTIAIALQQLAGRAAYARAERLSWLARLR
jgi:pyruvate/2-oxoglutarate dehydrogenase complex dihydrolipoamide dehydrogenase (E3) component